MLVNAARGGIVDEAALYDALKTGAIAAAGLDVFAKEPCTDSPLFELENVVATPHLGASTDEAQEKAGIAVARSVRLALSGELVPDAVNVQGGVIAEDVRPGIPLTEKLGRIFTGVAGEVAQQLDVEVRGEITDYDVKVLELAALKGVFTDIVEDQVSYVNAPLLAAERGTAVRLVADPESPDHRNLITIRGTLADGSQVSVSGTLVGIHQRERLVEVNGFDVDIEPTDHLAFFTYSDRPGMVGTVGQILGDAGVNIAGMQVSRDAKGGHALVALSVDSAIPPETLAEIEQAIDAVVGPRRQPGLSRAVSAPAIDFSSGLVLNRGHAPGPGRRLLDAVHQGAARRRRRRLRGDRADRAAPAGHRGGSPGLAGGRRRRDRRTARARRRGAVGGQQHGMVALRRRRRAGARRPALERHPVRAGGRRPDRRARRAAGLRRRDRQRPGRVVHGHQAALAARPRAGPGRAGRRGAAPARLRRPPPVRPRHRAVHRPRRRLRHRLLRDP